MRNLREKNVVGWLHRSSVLLVFALALVGCAMPTPPETASEPVESMVEAEASTATFNAEQPTPSPTPIPVAEPKPEPTPPAAEPEPTPPAAEPAPPTATVTGTVVNLRLGPGTEHGIDGQARAGDQLHVVGRNAAGDWLQVMHPVATGELVWIYGPLTDIDAATVQTLADATVVELEVAVALESEEPTAPVGTPEPAPVYDDSIEDCIQWHTVNPNETRLSQITDWFGLDLAATAALNGIAPDAPLTAGTEICLPNAASPQPQPQPVAPAPQPAVGGACQTPIGPQTCIHIPDFPERGHPNAPVGQKVVDSPIDVLWNAPGTYPRDLLGLDYEFELVFTDNSVMWDWTVRDFEGCYDALRIHMGVVPKEVGLQRMELRLIDSFIGAEGVPNWQEWLWRETGGYLSPPAINQATIPWLESPSNWDPAALPHPDLGVVDYGCYLQPDEQALCDIVPMWGNSHSIHLNAAAAKAMANTVMYMSDNALANRYRSRLHEHVLQANAYLFPLLDNNRGEPAGQGPCADLWRTG